MNYPTLYKRTSTGATQMWQIATEDNVMVTTFGQVGGKQQVNRETISQGKNIGKSNETTAVEQAEIEALQKWTAKAKKGYVQSADDAKQGNVDETFITGGINPMLAQSYAKHGHKIKWPAFVQPKLDGHRCIAMVQDGDVTLWSRTRKPITGVPHIAAALRDLNLDDGTILDGELYNHDYKDRFEELTSFIRQPEPKAGHEVVQYHVYDVVEDGPFNHRYRHLGGLQSLLVASGVWRNGSIVVVQTAMVNTLEEAQEIFAEFVADGYEGLMLRNTSAPYEQKRSYSLQKMKEMLDSEFDIIGVESGRGRMEGKAIFVCRTESGATFRTKMRGSIDALAQYVDDPSLAVGKQLTVQYQGLTADGIPRFPIGLRIRQDV